MSDFTVEHTLAQLGPPFSVSCHPTTVRAPQWLSFNTKLANYLNIPTQYHHTEAGLALFSGNQLPDWCQPVAHAYAGHQFGHFVPQLGDGRAILLAEIIANNNQRYDMQLKGAGVTPFSRRGDGRSPLGPVLREYLVSEAMHAMGVPTTRALAAVLSGDWVQRETAEPGAILTRVAKSHIRVGSFQFASVHGGTEKLKQLADYVIKRHYPACDEQPNRYLSLLNEIVKKQARLIAQWMSLGFIHGVMNTDNMSIAGETIDYGPCAFMDSFNPAQVFSFIDSQGRYAWGNQPRMASWNLARLAEALLPLLDDTADAAVEKATEVLKHFNTDNEDAFRSFMAKKIGLVQAVEADENLIRDLLNMMNADQVDYTQCFRLLSGNVASIEGACSNLFSDAKSWRNWVERWQQRLAQQQLTSLQVQQLMDNTNPAIIPRNHIVAKAIQHATEQGDLQLFNRLKHALSTPFQLAETDSDLGTAPNESEKISNTFCGT